jgi:hypothetical protein
MSATAAASSGRWGIFDRALLIALVLAYIPGIPGVGIETRPPGGPELLIAAYTVGILAPIVALAASWKWPIAAGWIGVVGGLLAAALGGLDIAGLLGAPPPPGMIVVDAVFGLIGLAVAWRSWRVTRR